MHGIPRSASDACPSSPERERGYPGGTRLEPRRAMIRVVALAACVVGGLAGCATESHQAMQIEKPVTAAVPHTGPKSAIALPPDASGCAGSRPSEPWSTKRFGDILAVTMISILSQGVW